MFAAHDIGRELTGMSTQLDAHPVLLNIVPEGLGSSAMTGHGGLTVCHGIDDVDAIQALDAVEIALVDRIDAQIPALAIGLGPAAFGDRSACWLGLVDDPAPAPIAGLTEHMPYALAQLACGWIACN